MTTKKTNKTINQSRRKALKTTGLAAGAAAVVGSKWSEPLINSVVLPAHAQTSAQTIAEIATATDVLSTLVSLLTPAQVSALSGPGPLTVFAPTNQAFTNIESTVATLTAAEIEAIVNYHVVSGIVTFADIPATTGTAPTQVLEVDASNGKVFVISEVLLPPS